MNREVIEANNLLPQYVQKFVTNTLNPLVMESIIRPSLEEDYGKNIKITFDKKVLSAKENEYDTGEILIVFFVVVFFVIFFLGIFFS